MFFLLSVISAAGAGRRAAAGARVGAVRGVATSRRVRGAAAPVNLMAKLGNCLDQTKFTAIGLANLRTVPRTNENTDNCTGCNMPCGPTR